jgi:selenocysteine-specific elongation factor
VRPLGPDTARLRLARKLPLHVGDRALLRDPGRRHLAGGVTVLDVVPPGLSRRGAAAARSALLAAVDGPDELSELRRRGLVRRGDLARMGVLATSTPVAGDWLADPDHWRELAGRLAEEVSRHAAADPLAAGVPIEALRHALGLPDRALVEALVRPPLAIRGGLVGATVGRGTEATLPPDVLRAVNGVRGELTDRPFAAPEAARLAELGLGPKQIGAAVRAGVLLKLADNVVLLPDAPERAVAVLGTLPQPFATAQARRALDTTRRVAIPLLELLDRRGLTRRLPDDRRVISNGDRDADRPPGSRSL